MIYKNYLILTLLFFLFFFLVLILIFPLLDNKKQSYLRHNWPLITFLLFLLALIISLPLKIWAKELIINQDSFQVHLKIIQRPLPTPTPAPQPFFWINQLKKFFTNWLKNLSF